MSASEIKYDELLTLGESEFLDYKREYHSVNSDLIHDILCLANAIVDSNRFMVFGVDDSGNVCGVESDGKRKNLADIITMLRSARLNKIPKITLKKILSNQHEVDVLVIQDVDEKPYFLTEDYTSNGRPLRAGVIYSRVGDANTPVNSTASDHVIEKMFYERFGLKLSPKERLRKYLVEVNQWKHGYNENNNLFFYHEQFPEFTVVEKSKEFSETYVEPWSIDFPDKKSTRSEFFIKFHGTILDNLILVWLDGARNKRVQPRHKLINQGGVYYSYYFYVKNSLDHLVNEMIQVTYPDIEVHRGLYHLFPVFETNDEANRLLDEDFGKEVNQFVWYYFDQGQDDFIKVESGKKHRIFWKR